METIKKIKASLSYIETALEEIENAPEKALIKDLLDALVDVEESYKQQCNILDEDTGKKYGTTYKHGIDDDFMIEGELWHDVSIALRRINENG